MSTQMTTNISSVSGDIVRAVAEQAGEDPVELPPLYNYIDPDALESLFTGQQSGQIEFMYIGYRVSVSFGDGQSISVSEEPNPLSQ